MINQILDGQLLNSITDIWKHLRYFRMTNCFLSAKEFSLGSMVYKYKTPMFSIFVTAMFILLLNLLLISFLFSKFSPIFPSDWIKDAEHPGAPATTKPLIPKHSINCCVSFRGSSAISSVKLESVEQGELEGRRWLSYT